MAVLITIEPLSASADKAIPPAKNTVKEKGIFKQPKKPFLSLTPFKIPIFHSMHPYHTVTIDCTLEAIPQNWEMVKFNIPYIYHYMFVDLYYALNYLWKGNETPSKELIKKRLLSAYNKHFSHKWPITDIHIQGIKIKK